MTARQKEFIRHYLSGMSAPAAAKAAGYAACTAEKNAAYILSSPTIAAYIAQKRESSTLLTQEHLLKCRDRMLKILETGTDKEAALAYHALLKLYKLQNQLASQQVNAEPIEKTHIKTNKKQLQKPDNQDPSNKTKIQETDQLENGEPAFDQTFSPTKATLAKKPTTLILSIKKGKEPNHKRKLARSLHLSQTPSPQAPPKPLTTSKATASEN